MLSSLVEPCATTTCLSSGESLLAGAYPSDLVFAVATYVRCSALGGCATATTTPAVAAATATGTVQARVPALLEAAQRRVAPLVEQVEGFGDDGQRVAFAVSRLAAALAEGRQHAPTAPADDLTAGLTDDLTADRDPAADAPTDARTDAAAEPADDSPPAADRPTGARVDATATRPTVAEGPTGARTHATAATGDAAVAAGPTGGAEPTVDRPEREHRSLNLDDIAQ